jgi:hypothetical protein
MPRAQPHCRPQRHNKRLIQATSAHRVVRGIITVTPLADITGPINPITWTGPIITRRRRSCRSISAMAFGHGGKVNALGA